MNGNYCSKHKHHDPAGNQHSVRKESFTEKTIRKNLEMMRLIKRYRIQERIQARLEQEVEIKEYELNRQRQIPVEHKAEPEPDTFNLQRQVECKFYRLENEDTCIVCLEKCNVYYTETCEKPHFCCQNCWKTNLQNRCPVCRINIYI
jgi:hypothetical protein